MEMRRKKGFSRVDRIAWVCCAVSVGEISEKFIKQRRKRAGMWYEMRRRGSKESAVAYDVPHRSSKPHCPETQVRRA